MPMPLGASAAHPGVDETSARRGYRYVTNVLDAHYHELLLMVEGRKLPALFVRMSLLLFKMKGASRKRLHTPQQPGLMPPLAPRSAAGSRRIPWRDFEVCEVALSDWKRTRRIAPT